MSEFGTVSVLISWLVCVIFQELFWCASETSCNKCAPAVVHISMEHDIWSSHCWSSPSGRRLEFELGKPVVQHHCSRCTRDFIESPSGERRAVYVSVFSLRTLPDHISTQWLGEMCPGAPRAFDLEIRKRLIEHLTK